MYCPLAKETNVTGKFDKSGFARGNYHVLQKKINLGKHSQSFAIYGALTVIRESQFQKGKMIHLQLRPYRVFLKSFPSLTLHNRGIYMVSKDNLTNDQKQFRTYAVAYVRQTPTKDGIKGASPSDDSRVRLD